MKTAMQEMFSQLEIDQPQLFNINTTEGKTFVNAYIKFIELEKNQIKDAYQKGFNNAYFSNPLSEEQYFTETFK